MKLPKLTRKRIYAAAPEPCDIPWPDKREPKVGHKYTIQTDSSTAGVQRLQVLDVQEVRDGWKATVQLEGDRIRLLGKSGGYSESPRGAIGSSNKLAPGNLREEPEAVDAAEIGSYRASRNAKDRYQGEQLEEVRDVLEAMQEVRVALEAKPRSPEVQRALWIVGTKITQAESALRRRLAA